jgi:hypothetical protein
MSVTKEKEERNLYLDRYRLIMLEIKERTPSIGEIASGRTLLRGRKEINALTVPENPRCQAALITGVDSIIPFRVLSPTIARELCFLQLRMVCECIALSCLIAPEDIKAVQASKFQKEYSADLLMKMLEELHADFYPVPVIIEHPDPGRIHLADKNADHLSKSELIRLVHFCGDKLHRRSTTVRLKSE